MYIYYTYLPHINIHYRCPDSAKIKKKMLYSSSFDALKKSLVGVHKFIQVSVIVHTKFLLR